MITSLVLAAAIILGTVIAVSYSLAAPTKERPNAAARRRETAPRRGQKNVPLLPQEESKRIRDSIKEAKNGSAPPHPADPFADNWWGDYHIHD